MKGFTNASGGLVAGSITTDKFSNKAVTAEKLGDGAIPVKVNISLSEDWDEGDNAYIQTFTVSGYTITDKSKIDIQPDAAVLAKLIDDGVSALYIVNDNRNLTAVAIGEKPTTAMTIQATIEEVR